MDNYTYILKSLINSVSPISDKSFLEIERIVEINKFAKKYDFIEQGNINDSEYLILDGICQTYILGREGEEVTLNFFQGPTVLTPNIIRSSNGRSILNARSITNGVMVQLPVHGFAKLIEDNQDIRAFANRVLQLELIHKTQKEVESATLSAEKRLELLRGQFSNLENQVNQKHIASYLGISPESLSRIRKK